MDVQQDPIQLPGNTHAAHAVQPSTLHLCLRREAAFFLQVHGSHAPANVAMGLDAPVRWLRYLQQRLQGFDFDTLYELHYCMITLGKVLCTKRGPNCSSCPLVRPGLLRV